MELVVVQLPVLDAPITVDNTEQLQGRRRFVSCSRYNLIKKLLLMGKAVAPT